jgi:hypothetical protein
LPGNEYAIYQKRFDPRKNRQRHADQQETQRAAVPAGFKTNKQRAFLIQGNNMRDPRKNPMAGDILRKFGTTLTAAYTLKNERGTTTHIRTAESNTKTISAWRAWAKESCEVIYQTPEAV